MKTTYSTIDEYIRGFPASTQKILKQLRAVIRKAAPAASERISYQIPTFFLNGNLIHFAAYEHHIGLYGARIRPFERELHQYITGKGTLRFPIDQPIPFDLVRRLVELRVKEQSTKAKKKR